MHTYNLKYRFNYMNQCWTALVHYVYMKIYDAMAIRFKTRLQPCLPLNPSNTSNSCADILIKTKVVDRPTDIAIPKATLLVWLKIQIHSMMLYPYPQYIIYLMALILSLCHLKFGLGPVFKMTQYNLLHITLFTAWTFLSNDGLVKEVKYARDNL